MLVKFTLWNVCAMTAIAICVVYGLLALPASGRGSTSDTVSREPLATAARASHQACAELSAEFPAAGSQQAVEEVGLDGSRSVTVPAVRGLYRQAAVSLVDTTVAEHAELRIVLFGASGVGARTVFIGSFAPVGPDDVLNLAAANRARCRALAAIDTALATRAPVAGGTDVAGATASLVADARSLVAKHGKATVTVLTDGCQAPSSRGPNRSLTDLCGQLTHGMSALAVLRVSGSEFALGNAAGVRVVMRGVGVGRDPSAANTVRARRLVAFWELLCARAHAVSCEIGSTLP